MKTQITFETWFETTDDLREIYEEHVAMMQDSSEHKAHMFRSDKAFREWAEERFEEMAFRDAEDRVESKAYEYVFGDSDRE